MDFSVCDVILHSLGIYSRGCKSSHLLSHRPIMRLQAMRSTLVL